MLRRNRICNEYVGRLLNCGGWPVLLVCLLVACAPEATPIAIPTQTLIPATDTPVPTPTVPTATPQRVPGAADLLSADLTPQGLTPIIETDVTVDPDFIRPILLDLAEALDVEAERVRLVSVEEASWPNYDLGCYDDRPVTLVEVVNGYNVTLLVGSAVYEYHTVGTEQVVRCPGSRRVRGELLTLVDPVAAELVFLAQQRVAQTLDLPTRRIQLVDVAPVTWQDSSLGCPQPNQTYNDVEIDGYRIVVSAGDTPYVFHTDSVRLVPCDIELEELPA